MSRAQSLVAITPVSSPLAVVDYALSPLYLSPSKIQAYESCPRKYELQYVKRWSGDASGAALAFGNAIDDGTDAFLRAHALATTADPVDVFVSSWQRRLATGPMSFPAQFTPADMEAMGIALMQKFMTAWNDSGLTVAVDPQGQPILQRDLEIELPHRIIVRTKLDLLARTRNGRLALIDNKTAAARYLDDWISLSEQLTIYQIAVDAHADSLGIGQVDALGFITLQKRKLPKKSGEGPFIDMPPLSNRRSDDEVREMLQKIQWIGEDIRRQRFPKRPGYSMSSPCSYCDYRSWCARGEMDGIVTK